MAGVMVGSVEVLAVSDGWLERPASRFFPSVPESAWERYRARHLTPEGNVLLNVGSFLLRADGRTLLVDTGLGPTVETGGRLPAEMSAVGVLPEEVDLVLTTHMHGDHIGWNTKPNQEGGHVPAFPRARYLVQRTEWEHWLQPRTEQTPHIDEEDVEIMERVARPLEQAGVLELVEGEHAATPSVRFLPTPGHTPGHACILIDSGGEGAVILGDLAHSPAQVSEPQWVPGADEDGEQGVASRRALWERVEAHGLTICAGHFQPPNIGRLVRVEGRRMWRGG